MYNPTLGRFLQRDPTGYPDGMNSYAAYHVMRFGADPSALEFSDRKDDLTDFSEVRGDPDEQVIVGESSGELEKRRRRRLNTEELIKTNKPGGEVQKGTSGVNQNCLGRAACSQGQWIEWPNTGRYDKDDENINKLRASAKEFVPKGCKVVYRGKLSRSQDRIDSTYCLDGEREVIIYLTLVHNKKSQVEIGFHALGRTIQGDKASTWDTKIDRREEVVGVYDPRANLYNFYPWLKDAEKAKAVAGKYMIKMCCDCNSIQSNERK